MNLLIIGGLLVFGLLAIAGAILLARGEKGAGGTVKKPAAVPTSQTAENGGSGLEVAAVKDVAARQNLLAPQEETQLATLNGQFQELAAELRNLYQEAKQLEQRLSVLVEITNHIEYVQRERVRVEEEREESQ